MRLRLRSNTSLILFLLISSVTGEVRQCMMGTGNHVTPTILDEPKKGEYYRCAFQLKMLDETRCHLVGFSRIISDIEDHSVFGCGFMSDLTIVCACATNLCNRDVLRFRPWIVSSSQSRNTTEAKLARCVIEHVLPEYENPTRLPETTILTSSESATTTTTTTTTTGESTPGPSTTRRSSTTPRTSSTASPSEAGKVSTTAATTISSSVQPASDIPEEEDALTASTNTTVTPSPSSPHHCEAVDSSSWLGWFIGSLIVNGLQFVAILSLVYVMIKKGSVRGKDEKPKTKQPTKLDKPTSIQIEKADQGKTVVDTTTMEDNADELDTTGSSTISDSTTGTFGNDQPRITVGGFSK